MCDYTIKMGRTSTLFFALLICPPWGVIGVRKSRLANSGREDDDCTPVCILRQPNRLVDKTSWKLERCAWVE